MLILIAVLYHENEFGSDDHYHWRHQENWLLTSYTDEMPFIIATFCSYQKKNHLHSRNEPFSWFYIKIQPVDKKDYS